MSESQVVTPEFMYIRDIRIIKTTKPIFTHKNWLRKVLFKDLMRTDFRVEKLVVTIENPIGIWEIVDVETKPTME